MPSVKSPVILLYLFFGMGLFGTSTPLSKIVADGFDIFTASFMRMAIATLVLLPLVWPKREAFSGFLRKDWIVTACISLAGMVGFTAAMLYGMRLTTGVIGSTVMSSAPAVTALAAVVFMGAAMNWRKGGALALAVAGVLAINIFRQGDNGGGSAIVLGALLVAVAVCLEAAYTLLSKLLSDAASSLHVTLAASVIAMPAFLVLALIFQPELMDFSNADGGHWIAAVSWGVATGGLAPVLWYQGVRQSPGALAAGFMAVMPVTALVGSYLLLDESFQWAHALGFGLVFAGVLLMIWEHSREAKSQVEPD